jgi:hypothetical protein
MLGGMKGVNIVDVEMLKDRREGLIAALMSALFLLLLHVVVMGFEEVLQRRGG